MKEKITVFGSFAVDLMARAPHIPVPAETVKGTVFRQGAGGKGFNQAVAAHKAGADVVIATKLGRDAMASVALDMMQNLGMSQDYLSFHDTVSTGAALILVDEGTGQNAIVVVPGACATINDEDLARIRPRLLESSLILLQLEVNQDANEKVARLAKAHGIRLIVNTAPYCPVSDDFLRGVYLVTPNEVEAEEMTQIPVTDQLSARRAAAVLHQKGVENVLITMGSKGAFLSTGGQDWMVPAFRVHAVDTTGAGDAFNGGLIAALAEGMDLRQAAEFASAVAALSVQRVGAAPSMPTREEIDAFLASVKG